MTKARTKAARRRRSNLISLPGGRVIDTRKDHAPQAGRRAEPPADAIALASRAKLTGCTVEAARDVLAGEDMGRCILAMRPSAQDRRDLLGVWQGVSSAWANYLARCVGIAATAQSSTIPMLPDPMQTDQSLRVDLRTADERDAAARRVWDEWRAAFNRLPLEQALIITEAVYHRGPSLWNADTHQPTRHGALAVKALASLHHARTR
jgi:hypothetical protein